MPAWPRWHDPDWWRNYWIDVRPRLLWLEVRSQGLHLRWGVPAWAIEETLRALALTIPWLLWLLQRLPGGERRFRLLRGRLRLQVDGGGASVAPPWAGTVALLEGAGEGVLRLPPGEPFIDIETPAGGPGGRSLRVRVLCL
jgi:hypothetical protein